VIGTLAVDGWAVTFGTARRGLGGAAARPGPAHPSTASVLTLNYSLRFSFSPQIQFFSDVVRLINRYIIIRSGNLIRLRGTVVERRSLTGELSMACARPAADHLCG